MEFEEYQKRARATAIYPDVGNNIAYPALGLVGEAGEVANKIKKIIRDRNRVVDDETRKAVVGELGDTLWYVSQLAFEFGVSLEEVAISNLEKLSSRDERKVLKGSGDER